MTFFLMLILFIASILHVNAFPHLAPRSEATVSVAAAVSVSVSASVSASTSDWSQSQLVDVTGTHAYANPLPGQARGPCPAQNAMANHGYLDRSGYTTLTQCVAANGQVYNMQVDFATFLCFLAQLTGGDLVGATWSIGNSSSFDSTIQAACPCTGLLSCLVAPLTCYVSNILDKALGTAGFGMAQTHDSFEADSSIMTPDYTTLNGLDASTRDPTAVQGFVAKQLSNKTFDDPTIWQDWAYTRMLQGIATNPCYMRVPQATLLASLGAYAFTFKLLSNHTREHPRGTLNVNVLGSFFSFQSTSSGDLQMKGLGHEQIPNNWYQNPVAYGIPEFMTEDYPPFFERHPELSSLGGNTNGVNTFTGIDIGDLTGGVMNGTNLLQGDNFVCFLYRVLQIDLENKLPSAVGGALLTLGGTIGEVLTNIMGNLTQNPGGLAACPAFTYKDIHSYTSYCGVRQQPGAIV